MVVVEVVACPHKTEVKLQLMIMGRNGSSAALYGTTRPMVPILNRTLLLLNACIYTTPSVGP